MRSKRFCAEDRGFLSETEFSESTLVLLAVVLRVCTSRLVYWRCGVIPGLQVSWHVFVCLARSVLVSAVRKLGQRCVAAPLLRVFIFLSVFRVCPTFAVMLLLFGAVCSVFVGVGPVSRDACMNWARVFLRNAPVHALGPGLDLVEA